MKFINTQTVTITDQNDREELTCIQGYGVFNVLVEDIDHPDVGASAIFNVAANRWSSSIQRPCSVQGQDGETLNIYWSAGERPFLSYIGRTSSEFMPKHYMVVVGSLIRNSESHGSEPDHHH